MKLGKANYGTQKKIFKIEDGDNVYRILPPMGELAESGTWAKYYAVCWGYKNSQGKNKPFVDPSEKNRANGQMEQMSAALERRTQLEIQQKKMKEAGATKEQMEKMSEILQQFNIDKKYYVNAVDLKGQIGLLKIGYKAYKQLMGDKNKGEKGLIDKLMDKGIDPISSLDNGRYFNIQRQGRGRDTQYTVSVYQENVEVNGQIYQQEKVSKIDQNIINRLEKEAFNLATLYPTPSLAEVSRIVKEGPTAVDAILGDSNQSAFQDMQSKEETVDVSNLKSESVSGVSAPVSMESSSLSEPVPTEVTPVESELSATTPAAAPVEPVTNGQDLDPDAFLKSMGVNIG